MSFTAAQRIKVYEYLGFSDGYAQTANSILEQALNRVGARPDSQARVEAYLAALADLDTRLTGSYTRLKALSAGPMTLRGSGELLDLRSEGRRWVGRLAALLGVPILSDAYGASPPTDNYTREG